MVEILMEVPGDKAGVEIACREDTGKGKIGQELSVKRVLAGQGPGKRPVKCFLLSDMYKQLKLELEFEDKVTADDNLEEYFTTTLSDKRALAYIDIS